MNAGQWALSHRDLAAAVTSVVEPQWLTLFCGPARARQELTFELRAIDSDLGWLGWMVNVILLVADVLVELMETGMLGAAWVLVVGALLGVAFNGMCGYGRLLRARQRTRRQLVRLAGGGAA